MGTALTSRGARRTGTPVRILLATALALTAMLTPSTATAAACAVRTSTASATNPHVRDPLGDPALASTPAAPPAHEPAVDIRSLWLKVSGSTVTANIAVASLATHPVGAAYYVEFSGKPWLSARALPDGTWAFTSGLSSWTLPMGGVREETQAGKGRVVGNTISITVPSSYVPRRPANGTAVRISAPIVRTAYSARAPLAGPSASGLYATTDSGDNAKYCSVLLYG